MRHRDLHILTVGAYTYTSDQRFTATYHRNTNEWTLQIKFAQKRDAGAYECQISTQPVKSFSIDLHIVGKWLKINDDNLRNYTSYPTVWTTFCLALVCARVLNLCCSVCYSKRFKTVIFDKIKSVQLNTIPVPTAIILGGPEELYVDKGSSINLTCLIRFCPEKPSYIFWYHNDDVSNTIYFHHFSTMNGISCLIL